MLLTAPEHKKAYIKREWWSTRRIWAYFEQQRSCMLLQVMTTNSVEAQHHSLKIHAGGEEVMETFSFSGVTGYVLNIGDRWEQQAFEVEDVWFKTRLVECTEYPPELAQFPGPVQSLIHDQLQAAKKADKECMYW